MSARVTYECAFRKSKAAYARFGEAIFTCQAAIPDTYNFLDQGETLVALVQVSPDKAEQFQSILKPIDWRYRSPTWFDNGMLRAHYKTPEEEISAKARKETDRLFEDELAAEAEKLKMYP